MEKTNYIELIYNQLTENCDSIIKEPAELTSQIDDFIDKYIFENDNISFKEKCDSEEELTLIHNEIKLNAFKAGIATAYKLLNQLQR